MCVSPVPIQQRICLVGDVINDRATAGAAQTFGVPVIELEDGCEELIADTNWTTYFILNDFEGAIFKTIKKTKHR